MSSNQSRIFELRTYTSHEGKFSEMVARFPNRILRLFEKHGMTGVAYWVPEDAPASQNTFVYVLSHPSREAAKKNWESFRNDPEWKQVQIDTETNGKLVSKIESVFLDAVDFSPLK